MLKTISQTFLGLFLITAGGILFFVFLQGLADNSAPWAIIAALPIIVSGILLLVRAGKSDATVMKKVTIPVLGESESDANTGLEARINENNKMTAEWNNTNKARERLHMLEVQASSSKGS